VTSQPEAHRPAELGRPSAAATRSWPLRTDADGATAAYRADGGAAGPWRLRVASVVGVRHRLAGRPGQDAYGWLCDGSTVLAAVADGLGGVDGSRHAALAAVSAALAAGRSARDGSAPWDGVCAAAVEEAGRAVAAAGGATTLVVVAASSGGVCRLARVGDSAAMVLEGGEWHDVFLPPGGGDDEMVSTATPALPDTGDAVEEEEVVLAGGGVLVLASDGVADPIRDGPTTVAPAYADSLAEPPSPLALAGLLDFSRQGCHDDRTLLGLWWPAPGEAPASS
jgi:serine/threonine protein phosphatase PrpC